MDQARLGKLRVDNSAIQAYPTLYSDTISSYPRVFPRIDHPPVIDSLLPIAHPSASLAPSNHQQATATAALIVLVFLGLCTLAAMVFLVVRYFLRRAAIKRRRQASWILKSGHWNMESKLATAHETRTGCSDASSSFTAYPYPLSEHFSN